MIDWEAFKRQVQARPSRMLGYVLAIALCFLLLWVLVVIQTDSPGGQRVSDDASGRLDGLYMDSARVSPADSLRASPSDLQSQPTAESKSGDSLFLDSLPTFLLLLAAVTGLWIWIKVRDADPSSAASSSLFTEIATQELSNGQQLIVIRINSEYWVLSSGMNDLSLLHRFTEEQWDGPDHPAASPPANQALFARLLKKEQQKDPSSV
ncbi:flagellar biosynthetic protein FliO [Fodinibius sediminis]|uniref:Flagellar biogenesis protein FliO n=1 Tax=Fodinibius sediminis TaxID=1214077 RepID=A0A521CII5_9BACT|nr:flagellar biosynthetic protein FliO [Fodinibius sediminis]SMO59234.1 Flagellar biogenesis protein FliO [Fodinibius sediminis]